MANNDEMNDKKDIAKRMRRILIDLDILTNALWKGQNSERAKKFLEKARTEDFEVLTPSALLDLVFDWKDRRLAKLILSFYSENSDILSKKTILRKFKEAGTDYKLIMEELTKTIGKEEDAFLILVASVFDLEIITFNKKHMVGKRDRINQTLVKFALNEVEINEPI